MARHRIATMVVRVPIATTENGDSTQATIGVAVNSNDIVEWAARKSPKRKRTTVPQGQWDRLIADVNEWMRSGDWTEALPRHFVALYAVLHQNVYTVDAALTSKTRLHAAGLAARLLKTEFGDDRDALAAFVRWTWIRERGREKWRREQGVSGARITWQRQFSTTYLADYRVDLLRHKG